MQSEYFKKPLSELLNGTEAEMLEAVEILRSKREALRSEAIAKHKEKLAKPTEPKERAKREPKPIDEGMATMLADLFKED